MADHGSVTQFHASESRPNSSRKNWKILLAGLAVGALVSAFAFLFMMIAMIAFLIWETRPPSQIAFEASTWRSSPGQEVRWRMHKDLIKSGVLEGITETEAVELLGPDCQCGYFSDWDLVYNMGIEQNSLFAIDSVWLVLDFGTDGRYIAYDVVTD